MNNREIKFRAWGSYPSIGGSPPCREEMYYFTLPDDIDIMRIAPIIFGSWMQYTGKKDKNGKEIYEGDICRVAGPKEGINSMNYNPDRIFKVVYNPPEYQFFTLDNGRTVWDVGNVEHNNIEVIGNIYETPELLEN